MQAKVGAARSRDRPKARVAAFEAALTDRVHLGADNYGPVVGRTTRAMGDGRTLQQTRCHCGSIWDGHTWGPGKKEWEAHVGSMKHLAWVQSASRKRAAPPYELVQYLSWVGTCPEFASEPAIPAPDHAGPTRETAAEPAGTCPEFAPPLDEIRQVWTGFRRNLLEPDQVQQSPNLTENHPHTTSLFMCVSRAPPARERETPVG